MMSPNADAYDAVPSSISTAVHNYYHRILTTTQVLVYGRPEYPWSASILLWVIRILTFSILLRTYLAPWFLQLISKRIRIRSVSLRSVRGIFFRQGNRIFRVERIGYAWNRSSEDRRFTLSVRGFSLEVGNEEPSKIPKQSAPSKLAFLNPKPVLDKFKQAYQAIFKLFEPVLRPIGRKYAVACMQLAIRWLPVVTRAIAFEIRDSVITFTALPGTKIVVREVNLGAFIEFLQTEQEAEPPVVEVASSVDKAMAIWSNRLRDGFRRSLDRAWGSTQGTGRLTFKIIGVEGTMPIQGKKAPVSFLSLPNTVELSAGLAVNPRAGTIEPHSLEVSLMLDRLNATVDLLNTVLSKVKPPPSPEPVVDKHNAVPPPLNLESLRPSFFLPSPRFSSAIQSATSFTSSMFSPGLNAGVDSARGPTGTLLSPKSLKSPASPFFQAISASMARQRRSHYRRSTKLSDETNKSSLSVLKQVKLTIKTIRLSASSASPFSEYSAMIKRFDATVGLADPKRTSLHQNWLGKRLPLEIFDPDTYSLSVTLEQIKGDKESALGSFAFLVVGPATCNAVAHQWPPPLLVTSPLLRGDPNAPFVGVSCSVAFIEATQKLQDLRSLVEALPTSDKVVKAKPSSVSPPSPLALPRIVCGFDCGPMSARLLFTTNCGTELRALIAKTNGFVIGIQSSYRHASASTRKMYPAFTSVLPVEMQSSLSVNIEPLSVHTRSIVDHGFDNNIEAEDPCVFSAGSVHFNNSLHAIAETDGPGEAIAVVDKPSISCDSHIRIDSICIELWNPMVVDSVHQFLSLIPPRPPTLEPAPAPQPFSRFRKPPIGILFTASLSQCVAFVTAPDINPNDTFELSRGLSFRTGAGLQICSIQSNHEHWYDDETVLEKRSQLSLPLDAVLQKALAKGHIATAATRRNSAFFNLQFHHSIVRSLVATQFAPSEVLIAETLNVPRLPQDFVRIKHIQLEGTVTEGFVNPETADTCAISVHIPSIRADFKLAHVYSVLLAVQTLESLKARRYREAPPKAESSMSLQLQFAVNNIQVYWTLPKRDMVTRLDGLSGGISSEASPQVGFKQLLLLVPLPARVNGWEEEQPDRWDELLNLQKWDATILLDGPNPSVAVTGESSCLRIPHGFIFNDLVFDASILAKALKHVTHITKAGRFWKFPSPEPEGPKMVPHLSFRLVYFCIEVQDDPFECKLNRIWQAGFEGVKQRMDREEAFLAKVAVITSGQQTSAQSQVEQDYHFNPKHSITIEAARHRLDVVHVIDWRMRVQRLRDVRIKAEQANLHKLFGGRRPGFDDLEPDWAQMTEQTNDCAPLLRAGLHNLNLMIGGPSFPLDELSTFLFTQGSGMPTDTQFSLLIPMHIHFTLTALKVSLRDYPVPLFNILSHNDGTDKTVFTFDTDLVIAEEMGTDLSTEWYGCAIIDNENALDNEVPWSISVPKTIMPVKTYADPTISVNSPFPTILGWGISYGPAIQDVMRVIETLTSPPQDPSPAMGFWDKLRLIMHWKLDLNFVGDVQVYLKGSRSPYDTIGSGAGFVLAFQGSPRITIGYENDQKELIQIASELMAIAVPDMDHIAPNSLLPHVTRTLGIPKPFKKTCARLNSGVRFGIGFLPERACGFECPTCVGTPRERTCRLFTFKPHYQVLLETKPEIPGMKTAEDSYNEFRSDFVHLSLSLESALKKPAGQSGNERNYSSLHLTPQLFAHFWAWCNLFDGALSLPVRQGNYHPPKPISPKLGSHMATIKYRISIPHLYVMHGYMDESRETWVDGVTSWVGVKGMVDEFHVDMHQREEESIVPGPIPGTTRTLRRKPFNAAEVVLKGLDMRALVATFPNPLKKDVPMSASQHRSNYRQHSGLPLTKNSSPWHDINDFIELDWTPRVPPLLHLVPVVTCPRFSYFKRTSATDNHSIVQKFGSEHSHTCLLDKEPSAPRVQILLASARAAELRRLIRKTSNAPTKMTFDQQTAEKMVALLEDYVTLLQDLDAKVDPKPSELQSYFLPSEIISDKEWAEFENVYHIHCPSIFLDAAIRDIMMQYYYCSRARKGIEYHMATRAVKFIRDQANTVGKDTDSSEHASQKEIVNIATTALRKILGTDKASIEISREHKSQALQSDPMDGWADGVALRKSHCCLLLKPQIVLRGADPKDTCIVAASQSKLQSYAIMDILNSDDPVSGKIMSRNYTSLSGMQVYAPTNAMALGNNSIPLEVLIDLRCESSQFERLVPQTDAAFHYDKFNRLRLRNKATLALTNDSGDEPGTSSANHLQDQTDLVRVHIPRFTVSASTEHFQAISNVVTKLLLFSDAAHKTRLDRLETLIFAYDFRDLSSAATAICSLQGRLRDAVETLQAARSKFQPRRADEESDRMSALRIKAHIYLLQEELSLLFDAIKLAQDRFDASAEQNNALLLHASSSEISWRMLDQRRNLLAKLVVQDINFHWLNRQDSSTVNHLTVGNLTAFDGSRYAMWAEIISKYDEPANHPLLKKGLFCLSRWTILAPVGGITIYENFELFFHPMRLQIDAKVGSRIMEYVWPARKDRQQIESAISEAPKPSPVRASVDSPTTTPSHELSLPAPRRLPLSRSFTDLKGAREHGFIPTPAFLNKNRSIESLSNVAAQGAEVKPARPRTGIKDSSEADVMKTRSTQKSFVFVRVASLNLLLSISKEGSFECRDARIKTKDLEYRNQTWSFEELVNQFIPSDMGWKGWVKMAFHQPLLPVLPVAKELLSKTKWTTSKSGSKIEDNPFRMLHPKMMLSADDDTRLQNLHNKTSTFRGRSGKSPERSKQETPSIMPPQPVGAKSGSSGSTETVSTNQADKITEAGPSKRSGSRKRVKTLFTRSKNTSKPKGEPEFP